MWENGVDVAPYHCEKNCVIIVLCNNLKLCEMAEIE